jgi:hypothetical protein
MRGTLGLPLRCRVAALHPMKQPLTGSHLRKLLTEFLSSPIVTDLLPFVSVAWT